jgi:cobalt/nickel transport system permease protein
MHTPDGFITSWICVAMLLVCAIPLVWAVVGYKKWMNKEILPKMALLSAIIFLLQMLNFPIASGTSGHFLGAALAAILLGPEAALIVIALVVSTQAIVFGDGGMLALGVNVFNMAVVGVFSAHFSYKFLTNRFGERFSAFVASWLSIVMASASASMLLAMSGHASAAAIFGGMLSVHAIIGIGEGLISLGAIALLLNRVNSISISKAGIYAVIAFAVAALAIPFASSSPDGMEKVSINLGFYGAAVSIYDAPLSDYSVSFLPEAISAAAAGGIGALICFGAFAFLTPFARISPVKQLEIKSGE